MGRALKTTGIVLGVGALIYLGLGVVSAAMFMDFRRTSLAIAIVAGMGLTCVTLRLVRQTGSEGHRGFADERAAVVAVLILGLLATDALFQDQDFIDGVRVWLVALFVVAVAVWCLTYILPRSRERRRIKNEKHAAGSSRIGVRASPAWSGDALRASRALNACHIDSRTGPQF